MPIRLIEDWSTEDDDVADNAETIKDGEGGHQTQEGRLGKITLFLIVSNEALGLLHETFQTAYDMMVILSLLGLLYHWAIMKKDK